MNSEGLSTFSVSSSLRRSTLLTTTLMITTCFLIFVGAPLSSDWYCLAQKYLSLTRLWWWCAARYYLRQLLLLRRIESSRVSARRVRCNHLQDDVDAGVWSSRFIVLRDWRKLKQPAFLFVVGVSRSAGWQAIFYLFVCLVQRDFFFGKFSFFTSGSGSRRRSRRKQSSGNRLWVVKTMPSCTTL